MTTNYAGEPMPKRKRTSQISGGSNHDGQLKVLLVGPKGATRNKEAKAYLRALRPRNRSTNLPEALGRLEIERTDIILLGAEFGNLELKRFQREAKKRGFIGPIINIVSAEERASILALAREMKWARALQPALFTEREKAFLTRVAGGWTNPQIAHDLKCSEGSVKAVLQQLFGKLGVRKRTQIVRLAFEQGLPAAQLPPPRSPQS